MALLLAPAAQAHHLMDGPATQPGPLAGLLSGLAHPLLGPDHLIFLLCAGLIGWQRSRRWVPPLLLAGLLGSLLGLIWPDLPALDPLAPLSLVLLALVLHRRWPASLLLPAMAIHGYALSATVIGWEPTPVLAYLSGLLICQSLLLLLSITVLRRLWIGPQGTRWLQKALPLVLVAVGLSLAGLQLQP